MCAGAFLRPSYPESLFVSLCFVRNRDSLCRQCKGRNHSSPYPKHAGFHDLSRTNQHVYCRQPHAVGIRVAGIRWPSGEEYDGNGRFFPGYTDLSCPEKRTAGRNAQRNALHCRTCERINVSSDRAPVPVSGLSDPFHCADSGESKQYSPGLLSA